MVEAIPAEEAGRTAAAGATDGAARRVFYLFRTDVRPATPVGRFTDRDDAVAAATSVELIGWRVSVRSRLEGVGAPKPPWRDEYRSPRRRRARRGARAA